MKFTVRDMGGDFVVNGIEEGEEFLVATIHQRGSTTRLMADEIADALQRRFGQPIHPSGKFFLGVAIPPALDEVARLLTQAESLPPERRSPQMVDAIARFIRYCDAEGIALQRKPPPEE